LYYLFQLDARRVSRKDAKASSKPALSTAIQNGMACGGFQSVKKQFLFISCHTG
jgi:hypothetical protein